MNWNCLIIYSLPVHSLLSRRDSLSGLFLDQFRCQLDFLLDLSRRFVLDFSMMARTMSLTRLILRAERHDLLVISATHLTY